MSKETLFLALDGGPVRVVKRKPGKDYFARVYRIAGALPFMQRLKIALRIVKG
jgi:hypothetical protein